MFGDTDPSLAMGDKEQEGHYYLEGRTQIQSVSSVSVSAG